MVNESSVFEPLKFCCICNDIGYADNDMMKVAQMMSPVAVDAFQYLTYNKLYARKSICYECEAGIEKSIPLDHLFETTR